MTPKCSRKPLACDSWSYLIFKHFDVISVVCRRVYIPWKIVIYLKKIYMTFFLFTSLLIMNLRLESGVSVFPANKQTSFCNEWSYNIWTHNSPFPRNRSYEVWVPLWMWFHFFYDGGIALHCIKNMPDAVSTGCKRCNAHSLPQQNLSYTHTTSTNYWSCRPHCSYVSWARHWTRDAWGTSKSRTFIPFTNKFARRRWRLADCDTELFWIL